MGLDVRLPIGALFTVIGFILVAYGLVSNRALYQRSLGININLEWGALLLIFGVIMVISGRGIARNRAAGTSTDVEQQPSHTAH